MSYLIETSPATMYQLPFSFPPAPWTTRYFESLGGSLGGRLYGASYRGPVPGARTCRAGWRAGGGTWPFYYDTPAPKDEGKGKGKEGKKKKGILAHEGLLPPGPPALCVWV